MFLKPKLNWFLLFSKWKTEIQGVCPLILNWQESRANTPLLSQQLPRILTYKTFSQGTFEGIDACSSHPSCLRNPPGGRNRVWRWGQRCHKDALPLFYSSGPKIFFYIFIVYIFSLPYISSQHISAYIYLHSLNIFVFVLYIGNFMQFLQSLISPSVFWYP